jgi:poly-gamma-glutamate capsule biosynthesis protein CapA/YwtB (metallophosphatase superfamily)
MFPSISIAAVGDIMIGNHTTEYIESYGVDYPFNGTSKVLSQADIAFANLESPFTHTGTKFEKKFNFKVPPDYARGLIRGGFDVVTLANNHILDYGMEGLKNTITVLDSIGLNHCGAGLTLDQAQQPAIIERNGFRIGFLGYSLVFPEEFWATRSRGGTNYPTNLEKNIRHADSLADFIVVTFHWGAEGMNYPKEYQKFFAHTAIDCGTDLVLGHHPHVLQGLEIYKNRLIAYSLGNFSFSSYSRRATESIILKVYLTASGLLFAKIIPVSVDNYEIAFQPEILSDNRAENILAHLRTYSEPLNPINIINDNGYVWGGRFSPDDSLYVQQFKKISSNNRASQN